MKKVLCCELLKLPMAAGLSGGKPERCLEVPSLMYFVITFVHSHGLEDIKYVCGTAESKICFSFCKKHINHYIREA